MEGNVKLLHPYGKVKSFRMGIKSWKNMIKLYEAARPAKENNFFPPPMAKCSIEDLSAGWVAARLAEQ